ncbi:PREDICTED: zinc finger SWIM domain-containing protein 7-like [Priapulus caudatus]|uniref:Zinc finger SWIM domain-containing protein 7-like n=1 Tax=Priapulus caudatus TaxID=37621 RepID=A0ABM1EHH8_PRICU|nr:PREDICTED: zinc finger SWIM domain-containing protein 7-like [Priapulus caudatus]XP_014671648.1 PREDICTED: zinc finger SWIM domain-containing protein 7-like [Priapulus caudatus]XP_014671649.1 PREDICTED: zinc finger SWIM domain-containing protein 7-like [Priapulus caudatus]
MEDVVDQLLQEVAKCFQKYSTLTDEVLSGLAFVFQGTLLPALSLVDSKSVTRLVSPSSRCLYEVRGSSGNVYMCFEGLNYCCCPSYTYSVLKRRDSMMCKHILAVRLSEAMQTCCTVNVQDDDIATIIINMDT